MTDYNLYRLYEYYEHNGLSVTMIRIWSYGLYRSLQEKTAVVAKFGFLVAEDMVEQP